VLSINGVHTLIDVVIVDFIQIDLVSQVFFHEVVTTIQFNRRMVFISIDFQ
jgi:hypothetical protein